MQHFSIATKLLELGWDVDDVWPDEDAVHLDEYDHILFKETPLTDSSKLIRSYVRCLANWEPQYGIEFVHGWKLFLQSAWTSD